MRQTDVVIAGGGTAGALAAVASARGGAKTLVIERDSHLGGTAVFGIPFLGTLSGDGREVQSKLVTELFERLVRGGYSPGLIRGTSWNTPGTENEHEFSLFPFDAEGLKYVLQEMVCEAGAEILYGTVITGARVENGRVTSIEVFNKSGKSEIGAKVFVDCTGDADLVWLAHGQFLAKKAVQNSSILFHLGGVDLGAFYQEFESGKHVKGRGSWHSRVLFAPKTPGAKPTLVHLAGHLQPFENSDRQITFTAVSVRDGELYLNATRVAGVDGTDAEQITQAELTERKNVMEVVRALRENVHGFENAVLLNTSPLGIRESRNILGLYTMTREDVLSGRRFEDSVAYGAYPSDVHDPKGGRTQFQFIEHGKYYSVPFRAMLPAGLAGVIAAGRCISADPIATGTVRIMGCVLSQGAAAGAIAAECVRRGEDPQKIDVRPLQPLIFGEAGAR